MMIPFEFPDPWIPRKRMGQARCYRVTTMHSPEL